MFGVALGQGLAVHWLFASAPLITARRWLFRDDSRLWIAAGGITTVPKDMNLMIGDIFGTYQVLSIGE